jgi:hypothetical protein
MFRTIRTGALAAGVLLALAGALSAGGTRSFRQTTAKDFEEGEATASMILPTGEVVPGMSATRVPVDAAFVWCSATSPDGQTAYFGTGDQGRIYAVAMRKDGQVAPLARKLAELDAPWVTSIVVRPDGTLLAGTTPGGRIFSISPKGEVRQFAKLQADHVWTLVHDAKNGVTYAGTGGTGKVFAIDAKGNVRLHWDSGDKQVVSLVFLAGGSLLAGTSEQGILYRVLPGTEGRAEALHDFDADEVRAILRTSTATYVAVNDFDKASEGPPSGGAGEKVSRGTKITLGGGTAPASVGALPRPSQAKARSAVYRLGDEGGIEQVFTLGDGYLTALMADGSGDIFAAAGTQGKIYRLLPDRTFALAADLSERQALTLLKAGDGFLVGTGDVGGVYEVRPAAAGQASYLSKIFDAEFFASWGRLRWSGSPNLSFETRAGNTAKPDKTWSAWKKVEGGAYQGGEGEAKVASGAARYLQYRLGFPAKGISLKEVSLYYLPQNQRPRVTDVYLGDAASASSGSSSSASSATSTARAHSSVLKLRWRVDNPDGDELVYRLAYKQESESVWRPLGGPEPLSKPEYDWSTDSVPDGRYVVRVWASDEKTTVRERALDSTFVSAPLLVDNSRPEVIDLSAKPPVVTGRARDAASVVSYLEYSIDGQEWRPATPNDGLLDQRSEAFTVRLPPTLAKGPHVVNVRAWDATDNLGAGRVQVDVK